MAKSFGQAVLHVATHQSHVGRKRFRIRRTAKRARVVDGKLAFARLADRPTTTWAKMIYSIHVPLLETDRAPRPAARRHRLRLRVRLAPQSRRLVLRGDARADLVGVRPGRGAVDDLLRRGRRRLRPRRLRRPLGPDLLTGFAVAAVAPVDALTVRRAVPAGSRVAARRGATRGASAPPPTVRASAPGAHCVVPHGQLSLAFSPHMVHVVRSLAFFARALTCSYSRCFFS